MAIKRKHNVINCKELCSKDVAEIIVPLHIHSGSDTTAAFFGHGKASIFTKAAADDHAQTLLETIEKYLPISHDVQDDMETFTIRCIYNDRVSKSLGEARARKWNQMKRRSIMRLPPDRDLHNFKVTRGSYHTYAPPL